MTDIPNRRMLVIEDNPDDISLLRRALQKQTGGVQVEVIEDGLEALDYLFAAGTYAERDPDLLPRVILLDIYLPGLNGLEVLRFVRANRRTRLIPVVVLTMSQHEGDMIASYERGANSYIRKPLDSERFYTVVQQIERYWLDVNETY